MNTQRLVTNSLRVMARYKLRSGFMMLGSVVGVAALTFVLSVGKAAERKILGTVRQLFGASAIVVSSGGGFFMGGPRGEGARLTLDDVEAVAAELAAIEVWDPLQVLPAAPARSGGRATTVRLMGQSERSERVWDRGASRGEYIDAAAVAGSARVAVIGETVVRELFGEQDPLGAEVFVGSVPLRVIGVLQRFGTDVHGMDRDNEIVVPITTAMRRLMNVDSIRAAKLLVRDPSEVAATTREVKRILRERHALTAGQPDDFTVITSLAVQRMVGRIENIFFVYLPLVALVSLLAGGAVAASLMLVSVNERVGEIGLRRAVGARPSDIRLQFLVETAVTTLGGGVLGILLGTALALAVASRFGLSGAFSGTAIVLGLAVSMAVGLLAGVLPARRAALLQPTEALPVKLRNRLRLSLRALFANKVRAMLALASVAMGVAAVLVTSAVGKGAERQVLRDVETMGTNLLVVRPAQAKRLVARRAVRGFVTSLRVEDYERISELALVAQAAPGVESGMRVKAGGGSMAASVTGTSSAFIELRQLRLLAGRFLDADDDRSAARVAVIGGRVAETLFPGEEPVGQAVRIRGVPFEVIGVLEARGVLADGSDEDAKVFIPIRTALRRVFNTTWLSSVFVSVADPKRMDEAETQIRRLLRGRHRLANEKPDDFAVQNLAKLLAMQKGLVESLTLLTAGLAGVSLLVGGMGILALMLLSVKERTSEIGLRMAVGARPRDILAQFLGEATLLAVGGSLAGAVAGGLVSAAIALGSAWALVVPKEALAASLAMAVATGLGFGAFPARKASLVPPIQALSSGR